MNPEASDVTYPLTGLHCIACVTRVSNALMPLAEHVNVTLSPMQVTLSGPSTDVQGLQAAVAKAGKYTLGGVVHTQPLPSEVTASEFASPTVPALKATTVKATTANSQAALPAAPAGSSAWFATYYPLLLIISFILICSLLVQIGQPQNSGSFGAAISSSETMRLFMAGFFIVFAFFKLLDVSAFANAYAGYDLLAARWRGWGLLYPFIELGLGLAYLANWRLQLTLWVTVLVMGFSALGVIRAVLGQRKIQCACLGTVFQLPMSTVTIVEDVGMVLMAALMLLSF